MVYLNESLNAATVPGAVHVAQNGQLVDGTVTLTSNGQAIQFVPSAPWAYGALVQIFLDATTTDVNGTTVTSYQGSFTTVADPTTTVPAVVAMSPVNGATSVPLNVVVNIGYNVALNAATVTTSTVTLTNNQTALVGATVSLNATGQVIHGAGGAAREHDLLHACCWAWWGMEAGADATTCSTDRSSLQDGADGSGAGFRRIRSATCR